MRKKTKIIATISDLRCDVSFLQELFDNGMNVVRINSAHASFEGAKKIIRNVREVSDTIAILVDTKGPEIRTLPLNEKISVKFGDFIHIAGSHSDSKLEKGIFYVNYKHFVRDVPAGSKILIDDGDLELIAVENNGHHIKCKVLNDGYLQGKKSVNIPSAHIKLPALSKKDIEFINFAVEENLDFIAHSFVRTKEDIIAVQSILDTLSSEIKIIAKIENKEGVDNIKEILDNVYGIMIARGDLAIEISPEKLPIVQKRLVKIAIKKRKPVIVATQMLHSMIENPRPTRAEVNDIANAVFDKTDAIMLSGETAYGKYPLESVKMMTQIAKEIESNCKTFISNLDAEAVKDNDKIKPNTNDLIAAQLTKQAVAAAEHLDIRAVIADTTSGRTIRALAAYRGKHTIYAQCYSSRTMRELALSYGVHVDYIEETKTHSSFISSSLKNLIHKKTFRKKNLVLIVAGNFGRSSGVSYMEITTVKNLLEKTNI